MKEWIAKLEMEYQLATFLSSACIGDLFSFRQQIAEINTDRPIKECTSAITIHNKVWGVVELENELKLQSTNLRVEL